MAVFLILNGNLQVFSVAAFGRWLKLLDKTGAATQRITFVVA
jgi:hypothetical protein